MSTLNVDKVDPSTGTALEIGSSGDTITIPSGATIVNSGTATGFGASLRPNVNPLIINGDMAVAQRGTSFAAEGEQYTLDRWYYEKLNDGVVTITQEALTADEAYEDGFSTAIKVDVTTADTSFTTNQRACIEYTIEAQDLQLVKKGTANAEKLTLAFWVKATKTGTNIVRMDAFDTSRACSQAYTVSSTDTWEKKVLNFPADTTGVINNDNGKGLRVTWGMGAGTNYTSGTLATTWEAYTDANTFVGQVNNFDSTSNNFHITGVQLEVGEYTSSTIPPFQHESYGENLKRCARYYEKLTANGAYTDFSHQMITTSTTQAWGTWFFRYPKRDVPTFGTHGTIGDFGVMKPQGGRHDISAFTLDAHRMMIGTDAINTRFYVTTTDLVLGEGGFLCANNHGSAYIAWDAEL